MVPRKKECWFGCVKQPVHGATDQGRAFFTASVPAGLAHLGLAAVGNVLRARNFIKAQSLVQCNGARTVFSALVPLAPPAVLADRNCATHAFRATSGSTHRHSGYLLSFVYLMPSTCSQACALLFPGGADCVRDSYNGRLLDD